MASSPLFVGTSLVEERQIPFDASSDPPAPLFQGNTRLYMSYTCPYSQRVWTTRNLKGLQEKIKLVPLDLLSKPAWYTEKVNPTGRVPALEHNDKLIVDSVNLLKYIDSNFDGPSLYPEDPLKREVGEELLEYLDATFAKALFGSLKGDPAKETASVFDHVETALQKFDDGPFFLGELSLVDSAYITFIDRFQLFLGEVFKYDIVAGRPNLASWIEEMNKLVAFTQTKPDSEFILNYFRKYM